MNRPKFKKGDRLIYSNKDSSLSKNEYIFIEYSPTRQFAIVHVVNDITRIWIGIDRLKCKIIDYSIII